MCIQVISNWLIQKEKEMGFTLSTRNIRELGYCFCFWTKRDWEAPSQQKVLGGVQGWGFDVKSKHCNFMLTGCCWRTAVTSKRQVHFGITHYSNTGLWVGNRLYFTDTKETQGRLWTPKPAHVGNIVSWLCWTHLIHKHLKDSTTWSAVFPCYCYALLDTLHLDIKAE